MKVSVVIPCYNVAGYVERAVRSALDQTHSELDIICVDDGSTDGTGEILSALSAAHGITVVHQPNRGACAARNAGMERSNAEYIQFLDADDVILPEKIAHQIALSLEAGSPDVIVGSSHTYSSDGRLIRRTIQKNIKSDKWLDLMMHRLNITSTNLWRRRAVTDAGGWSEGLGSSQEYDLMFRIMKNGGRFVHDAEVLTEIHERPAGRISGTNLDRNWVRFIRLRADVVAHVKENHLAEDLGPYYQVLFDGIRTLYPYDRATAVALYTELVPGDFKPRVSRATGRGYLLLHRLFGFDIANRLRGVLRRTLNR